MISSIKFFIYYFKLKKYLKLIQLIKYALYKYKLNKDTKN